ncbi:hypothetical protein GCM10011574_34090 [Microbispora bryophytorum]|uniref:Uncharacterized protein n=1 Tax=Microbispora bryophytorum TaxID=1460882 RepID=A0A8H9H1S2_9ACTN|nr:hypothetical protein GCM10011574_34090 [Microbispora bryophytorum]
MCDRGVWHRGVWDRGVWDRVQAACGGGPGEAENPFPATSGFRTLATDHARRHDAARLGRREGS